jgi:uncharacterized protein (DUF302 family)
MTEQLTRYGFGTTVNLDFSAAVARTKAALAVEGFGVLCEIDVAATLRNKLGVDFRSYVILGACNPPLAHEALLAEREIGLLLPCNVIVCAGDSPEQSVVAALDPVGALSLSDSPAVRSVAGRVRERLDRAITWSE